VTARLVPLGGTPGPVVAIQRPVLLIGRHPDCDVRIDLPEISRRHCCIALAYDRTLIRDLGSRNGVRVNGRPVAEARLRPGDEIAIAQMIFRLEEESGGPAPAFQPPPATGPEGDSDLMPIDFD
jgi:pSer/pThr/pTyr-binding forkhead associated (FHA) protein